MPTATKKKRSTRPTQQESTFLAADVPLSFESPESSTILSAMFDPDAKRMLIAFKRDTSLPAIYAYSNIPSDLWAQFAQAASKGQFFSTRIRPYFAGVAV